MILYYVILSDEAGGKVKRVGKGKLRKEKKRGKERRENELPILCYVTRAE